MRSIKILFLFLAVAVLAAPSGAADKKIIESRWAATPVQVDAKTADWAPETLELQKDYDLKYSFQNDADFLFLLFEFNSNKFMSSIDFSGLTLWVNPEGKEKKTYGLHFYRKSVNADQLIQVLERQGQTVPEEQKAEFKKRPQYMLFVCDPVDKRGKPLPVPGAPQATFRTTKVDKSIIFEYQVPLALLDDPTAAAKRDPAQPLKIGFEWGGMTDEMKANQGAMLADQGVRAGASEGSLEGQMGGETSVVGGGMGRDFDASARRRNIPKKYDFWIDLKLASKK